MFDLADICFLGGHDSLMNQIILSGVQGTHLVIQQLYMISQGPLQVSLII